jgi:membrane protein
VAESTAISGVGLAILLLASIRLIFKIEQVVNAVWGAPRRRAFLPRLAIYTLVLFAFALFVGGFGWGSNLLRERGMGTILAHGPLEGFFPFAFELVGLLLLYRFLPNAKVSWKSATTAAAVAAALLEFLRGLFGLYVRALSRMNLITGSLTFLLLTLVSLFLVWTLILLGVELTHVLETGSAHRRIAGGKRAGRAENAVRMLLRLASSGSQPLAALYREQEAPSPEAERILECLRDGGLIAGNPREWTLTRKPEEITVAQIVEAVSPNLYTITPEEQDRVVLMLEPLFQRLDSERRTMLSTTLAELKGE